MWKLARPSVGFTEQHSVLQSTDPRRSIEEYSDAELAEAFRMIAEHLRTQEAEHNNIQGWNVFAFDNREDGAPFFFNLIPRTAGDDHVEALWYDRIKYMRFI